MVRFLSRTLPRKFAYWFGLRLADLFFWRDRAGRRAVMKNLNVILRYQGIVPGSRLLLGLARKNYQHFGKHLVDFFRFSELAPAEIRRLVSFEHPEYLQACRASGRGCILATAHLGSWEVGACVLTSLGVKLNAVALPERMNRVNRMFMDERMRHGLRIHPLGHGMRDLMRALKAGEFAALLCDRDFSSRNDRGLLFGRPVRVPRGPLRIARATGACLLPTFMIRMVDDTFLLRFCPPLHPENYASDDELQAALLRVLERVIGEHPHQWFMFSGFWNNSDRHVLAERMVNGDIAA